MPAKQYTATGLLANKVGPGDVIAAGSVFPALGIILSLMRLYTRRIQQQKIHVDDWTFFAGLIFLMGMGGTQIYGAKERAFGYPTPDPPPTLSKEEQKMWIPPETLLEGKCEFAFQLFMCLAYGFTKISIVAFYRRIFLVHKSTIFDYLTKATIVTIGAWTVAMLLGFLASCRNHLAAEWSSIAMLTKFCPGHFVFEEALVCSDLVLDMLIWSLPFPMFWRLKITTVRKFLISGVFLIGLMTIVSSIIRLVVYFDIIHTSKHPTADNMLAITLSMYWSMLEAGLAFLAAGLPPTSHFFKRNVGQTLSNTVRTLRTKMSVKSLRTYESHEMLQSGKDVKDLESQSARSSTTASEKPYETRQNAQQ